MLSFEPLLAGEEHLSALPHLVETLAKQRALERLVCKQNQDYIHLQIILGTTHFYRTEVKLNPSTWSSMLNNNLNLLFYPNTETFCTTSLRSQAPVSIIRWHAHSPHHLGFSTMHRCIHFSNHILSLSEHRHSSLRHVS